MSVFMFLHVYIVPYATFIKVIVLRLFCFADSPICLLGLYFCEAVVTQQVTLCDFFFVILHCVRLLWSRILHSKMC